MLDTVVGGNQREFTATGTLTGDGLKSGTIDALSSSAEFKATIPNLAWERTAGNATTNATFVKIAASRSTASRRRPTSPTAGWCSISRLSSRSARSPPAVRCCYSLTTGNCDPATEVRDPGRDAPDAPRPGNHHHVPEPSISVRNFRLQDATMQQIAADGTFGRPGHVLKVNFGNIDMALIDALLLRPAQLAGRLNGTSDISGTKDALVVNTTFRWIAGSSKLLVRGAPGNRAIRAAGRDRRRAAATDCRAVADRQRPCPARGLRSGECVKRSLRCARRQQPHRSRPGAGADDEGDGRDWHAATEGGRDRIGRCARVDGGLTVQRGAFKVEDTGATPASTAGSSFKAIACTSTRCSCGTTRTSC